MRIATLIVVAGLMSVCGPLAHAQPRSVTVDTLPVLDHPELKDVTPAELLTEPPMAALSGPEGGGWYAAAEFLLFTPRQRNLDFAIVDRSNDIVPGGRVQSLNYEMQPGVRATLAYRSPGLDWDIGITYTYFRSTDAFGTAAGANGLLYPTLTRAGLTNEAQIATAKARLTLNLYDIEIGRRWEASETLRLRMITGVRIMTSRQTLEANYDGRDADSAFAQARSNFDGAGPMAGVETWWSLAGGLGVYAKAMGGIVTGTMRSPFYETNNGGATVYADMIDRYSLTVPFATVGLGLSYEYRGVSVRIGYEVTNFFGLFERSYFVDDFAEGKFINRSSNLGLDGLSIQFGLSF